MVAQQASDGARLLDPTIGQLRVELALDAALTVPVRLAVPDQVDHRHHPSRRNDGQG
jgi:hypothetical protein